MVEIWLFLMKWKLFIFGITVVPVLLTLVYLFFAKPVFESRAVIRVGQVGNVGTIEEPFIMIQRLKEKYEVDDISKKNFPKLSSVVNIKEKENTTSLFSFKASGYSPQEARNFLNKCGEDLIREHNIIFDNIMAKRQEELSSLKKQLQTIDSKINLYDKQIVNFKGRDDSLIALLVQQKLGLESQRSDLERQVTSLEIYNNKPFTFATSFLLRPTLAKNAVSPRPLFSLALAGMFGLMLGVFLAFFWEFITKLRTQNQGLINKY